jgi:hypothetical protein
MSYDNLTIEDIIELATKLDEKIYGTAYGNFYLPNLKILSVLKRKSPEYYSVLLAIDLLKNFRGHID